MSKKILKGKIISAKADKTATVLVDNSKMHEKYGKRYTESKKYLVINTDNRYKTGDTVKIEETKPVSKNKYFKITQKVN